jgi:2-polyprenyl-6-hydroxyphenyl methylase/3-demethylubiquinone-9 3-methyltransferase
MTTIADPKNIVCLWFNGDAEEAAEFYAKTFPDTRIEFIQRAPGDYPDGKRGDVLVVRAAIMGIPVILLNGGPQFPQSESFSFQVLTEDQEETDRYWNAIVENGGATSQCGWCKDRWGLSWQITPRQLTEGMADSDPATVTRVFTAMMTMGKIDVAKIEAARRG